VVSGWCQKTALLSAAAAQVIRFCFTPIYKGVHISSSQSFHPHHSCVVSIAIPYAQSRQLRLSHTDFRVSSLSRLNHNDQHSGPVSKLLGIMHSPIQFFPTNYIFSI
jgi:hypothetical protein